MQAQRTVWYAFQAEGRGFETRPPLHSSVLNLSLSPGPSTTLVWRRWTGPARVRVAEARAPRKLTEPDAAARGHGRQRGRDAFDRLAESGSQRTGSRVLGRTLNHLR